MYAAMEPSQEQQQLHNLPLRLFSVSQFHRRSDGAPRSFSVIIFSYLTVFIGYGLLRHT